MKILSLWADHAERDRNQETEEDALTWLNYRLDGADEYVFLCSNTVASLLLYALATGLLVPSKEFVHEAVFCKPREATDGERT